jgi:hypothetical protein
MKLIASFAVLVLLAAELRAEIELTAVFITAEGAQFSLTDTVTGEARWVARGQTFAGFEVGGYDSPTEALTLLRDGRSVPARLKAAAIKVGYLSVAGTIEIGAGEPVSVTDATLVFGQASVFPVTGSLTLRLTATRRPDGNILFAAVFERKRADGTVEKLSAPSVIALPNHPFAVRVGDLGFGFKPRGI